MNATSPLIDDWVAALVEVLPIEDIWLLEQKAARECGLDRAQNLIVAVPDAESSHEVESAARTLLAQRFQDSDLDVFVFPLSTVERIPRPLLVKMALTSGKRIYCG
jgi:hypothetical protein